MGQQPPLCSPEVDAAVDPLQSPQGKLGCPQEPCCWLALQPLKPSRGTDLLVHAERGGCSGQCEAGISSLLANMLVAPKVMPPSYFFGNYSSYKEQNNTIW